MIARLEEVQTCHLIEADNMKRFHFLEESILWVLNVNRPK